MNKRIDGMTAARLLNSSDVQGFTDYYFKRSELNPRQGYICLCPAVRNILSSKPSTHVLMQQINLAIEAGWDGCTVESTIEGWFQITPWIHTFSQEEAFAYSQLFQFKYVDLTK